MGDRNDLMNHHTPETLPEAILLQLLIQMNNNRSSSVSVGNVHGVQSSIPSSLELTPAQLSQGPLSAYPHTNIEGDPQMLQRFLANSQLSSQSRPMAIDHSSPASLSGALPNDLFLGQIILAIQSLLPNLARNNFLDAISHRPVGLASTTANRSLLNLQESHQSSVGRPQLLSGEDLSMVYNALIQANETANRPPQLSNQDFRPTNGTSLSALDRYLNIPHREIIGLDSGSNNSLLSYLLSQHTNNVQISSPIPATLSEPHSRQTWHGSEPSPLLSHDDKASPTTLSHQAEAQNNLAHKKKSGDVKQTNQLVAAAQHVEGENKQINQQALIGDIGNIDKSTANDLDAQIKVIYQHSVSSADSIPPSNSNNDAKCEGRKKSKNHSRPSEMDRKPAGRRPSKRPRTRTQQKVTKGDKLKLKQPPKSFLPTKRPPVSLAIPSDEDVLSEYQCLVRKQIECFEATLEDINCKAQGRNTPVYPGQIGIRCIHCAKQPIEERISGSAFFSHTLVGLYQIAQNMCQTHFLTRCENMPTKIKGKLIELQKNLNRGSGGKKYWMEAAKRLGIIEDDGILKFLPEVGPNNTSSVIDSRGI